MVDFDTWYTDKGMPISAVAFLIKNENDKIELSEEHSKMNWVTEAELDNYTLLWPNAKRMLQKGFKCHRATTK